MQFFRLVSLVAAVLSFGLLSAAFPLSAKALDARCGCNDASVIEVVTGLDVQVKADVAAIAALVAKGDLNIDDYEAAIVTLTAHLNAAVGVLVALPGLDVGVQADVIVAACADILVQIFAVLDTALAIPGFLLCGCIGDLDAAIAAFLAALNVCAFGVLSLIAQACVSIKVDLLVNLVVFVKTIAIIGPVWAALGL